MMILIEHLHHQIKNFVCVCIKMVNIDKEACKNSDIEAIVDGIGTLWLHIE